MDANISDDEQKSFIRAFAGKLYIEKDVMTVKRSKWFNFICFCSWFDSFSVPTEAYRFYEEHRKQNVSVNFIVYMFE